MNLNFSLLEQPISFEKALIFVIEDVEVFSKVELNFDYLLEHFSHKLSALLSKIPNLSVSAKICIFV